MSPRRAAKKDSNQDEIIAVWEAVGWRVIPTHWAGQHAPGFCDFLACCWPITVWVEVKSPGGVLREDQLVFLQELSAPTVVCYGIEDAQRQAEEWRDRAGVCRGLWQRRRRAMQFEKYEPRTIAELASEMVLAHELGPESVVAFARGLGLTDEMPRLTMLAVAMQALCEELARMNDAWMRAMGEEADDG